MSNKEEFVENLVERIKEVNISEVFKLYGIDLYRSGGSYNCYSPFRKGASRTSFTISDEKGIFKDWVLPDYAGDSIKFVSLKENISYFEAIFELGLMLQLIDEEEYEANFKKRRYRKFYQESVEKRFNTQKIDETKPKKADIKDLDKVYRLFINRCKLSEDHLKYLKEYRNLTDDEIVDGAFFTFPSRYMLRGFLSDVEEAYGDTEILKTIPGFYRRVDEDRFTFNRYYGLGIPIKNEFGQIEGIQVRVDNTSSSGIRYFWFSSSFTENPDKKDEFRDGTGVGSPLSVIYPTNYKYDVLFITEGVFKAIEIAQHFNSIAISVQGVGNWKNIQKTIDNIEKDKDIKFKAVYIAYDADMKYNYAVYKQAYQLGESLKISNDKIFYVLWDEDWGKGIDDMIHNGYKNQIAKVKKELFDKNMKNLEEQLLKEYDETTIFNIEKDKIKEGYEKIVLNS